MTNYSHGHEAEQYAAKYLRQQGYKILDINWRRPRAEIDLVVQKKHGPLTFVEVKYRQTVGQGSGLDYITTRKLEQMRFAAELWVAEHSYAHEYQLAALEITGNDYHIGQLVEI